MLARRIAGRHHLAPRFAGEPSDEARGEPAGHREIAGVRCADGAEERIRHEVLRQVADRPVADRIRNVAIRRRDREHHDARVRQPRRKLPNELQPCHSRQVDVDEEHVGPDGQRR